MRAVRAVASRYGVALGAVALAIALRSVMWSTLGHHVPFVLLLSAVAVAAWYGGRGPALLAVIVGAAAVHLLFVPIEGGTLSDGTLVQMVGFLVEGIALGALTCGFRAARHHSDTVARRIGQIHSVSSRLVQATSTEAIARIAATDAAAAVGAAWTIVYLGDGKDGAFRPTAQLGLRLAEVERRQALDPDGWVATVAETDGLLAVEAEAYRRFPTAAGSPSSAATIEALLGARMAVDRRILGVLSMGFCEKRSFGPGDREMVLAMTRDAALALDRVRLLDAEKRARLEAEEANRAKDRFMSVASHELRTPLTAILYWGHLLDRGHGPDPARAAGAILRNARALSRLVEDILDVSRIEAAKLRIDRVPVALASVVRSTAEELRPAAAVKRIELVVSADDTASVIGDAERLRQIVRNLVCNAIKFTPAGGHVWIELEVRDGTARMRVRDDGKGIAETDLPHLFEPFQQVDASSTRSEGGLGLGLSIVRHLVEAHGGRVRIDSEGPGLGTTVTVEVPCARPFDPAVAPASVEGSNPAVKLSGLNVLLVDDDRDTVEVVRCFLEATGAKVECALSARQALEKLETFAPDVIVCDIGMPEQDGYALMRQIRALPKAVAGVPALALSAYARPDDVRAAHAAGFHGHLAKPANPDVLVDRIAAMAARR